MFNSPMSTAIVRSRRCLTSQLKPSARSDQTDLRPETRAVLSAAVTGLSRGAGRKRPAIHAIRIALAAYVTALARNGRPCATRNRKPARGPASINSAIVAPPMIQPLARSSRSNGTTSGTIAWLAAWNRISPVFTTNSTAYSSAMLSRPVRIAAASTPIAATLMQSTATISRLRSTRSTSTPPGSANSSHGSQATAAAAETARGLPVRAATNRGAATVASPLPSAETVLAAHSFANLLSSRASSFPDIASETTTLGPLGPTQINGPVPGTRRSDVLNRLAGYEHCQPEASGRQADPSRAHPPRRHGHRRVRMAGRQGEPGHHRVPRGGERLYRRDDCRPGATP